MRVRSDRPALHRLALAALLALAVIAGRTATADSGGDPTKAALERAAVVRRAIPAPVEPEEEGKPTLDFKFEGDLIQAGENAGSVTYKIDVGTYRDEPIWIVTEEYADEFGGSRTVTESVLWLKQDLSLVKGEWRRATSDEVVRLKFRREGDGFDVDSAVQKGSADPVETKKRVLAPADATYGRGAQLIFLKYAPSTVTDYALPIVNLDAAMPAITEHELPVDTEPQRVEVLGGDKYGTGKTAREVWKVLWRRNGRVTEAYFTPKTHELIGMETQRPAGIRIVPKGQGGEKPVYEDDKPATSWRAAFLKWGHGYHLAVERWIDAAIHWESMHQREIELGEWQKDSKLADFKRAYIAEFILKSKHRPRWQADALILQTIQTAEIRHEKDGSVVIASSPEYGGNIYHLKAFDGIWQIFRMDQ